MVIEDFVHPYFVDNYDLHGRQVDMRVLPARELLTHRRFDLFAKLFYIRHRQDRPALARRVYLENLRSMVPHGKEWGKNRRRTLSPVISRRSTV